MDKRQVASCGDPNLTLTYYEAFADVTKAHGINTAAAFANEDINGDLWQVGGASFLAWRSPGQPSTVPLYALWNPTTTDFVYLTSTTGSPPTLSGYTSQGIIAYVYTTQICGSVPLYAASQASVNDHWYTTNLAEHNQLIDEFGWTDAGVAAYVLPLNSNSMLVFMSAADPTLMSFWVVLVQRTSESYFLAHLSPWFNLNACDAYVDVAETFAVRVVWRLNDERGC